MTGFQPSKHLLRTNPQLGQVTESVEPEDLLSHPMVLDEPILVAVEEIPVQSGEWAGILVGDFCHARLTN